MSSSEYGNGGSYTATKDCYVIGVGWTISSSGNPAYVTSSGYLLATKTDAATSHLSSQRTVISIYKLSTGQTLQAGYTYNASSAYGGHAILVLE